MQFQGLLTHRFVGFSTNATPPNLLGEGNPSYFLYLSNNRDGDRFRKKNSNLCGDMADFTPPPPYLVQDFLQSPVIDMCTSKVLHWLPKKKCFQQPFMKTEDFSNEDGHSCPGCRAEEIFFLNCFIEPISSHSENISHSINMVS